MARPITFLSDYGLRDEFVGVVHAVIAHECRDARVIDLSHGVPRQSVPGSALADLGDLRAALERVEVVVPVLTPSLRVSLGVTLALGRMLRLVHLVIVTTQSVTCQPKSPSRSASRT